MSSQTPEAIIDMHHRSLPVGSTESITERLSAVTEWLVGMDIDLRRLEDKVRVAPLSSLDVHLGFLHELRVQRRRASRAESILRRELRSRATYLE